jgi:small subunit ribosomal protein S21
MNGMRRLGPVSHAGAAREAGRRAARLVAEVLIGDSESLDVALKRFNKRVQADGLLTEARRHEYYEKPSERRKKKEAARRRKLRKMARRKTDNELRS